MSDLKRTSFSAQDIEIKAKVEDVDPLEIVVFQALGAASACWDNLQGAGVFESEAAKEIGDDLVAWIRKTYEDKYPYPDGPYTTIGPECFTDGNVISYKGDNFYRACDYIVTRKADGSASFCVRRVGHAGDEHENYDGVIVNLFPVLDVLNGEGTDLPS